jgi:asparagine synthase (glutamine-hydrolysing)
MSGFIVLHRLPGGPTVSSDSLSVLIQHTQHDRVATLQRGPFTVCVVSRWGPVEDLFQEREGELWIGCGHLMGMEGRYTFREAFSSNLCGSQNWHEELRGHFAAARLAWTSGTISVATNRFGSVPVFWAQGPLGLVFATELPACLIASGASRDLDRVAVAETIMLDVPLRDRTLFKAVKQLPAGCVARAAHGRVELQKYWYYRFYGGPRGAGTEIVSEASRLVKRAVSQCLPDSRPVLLFVSGGLDSRLIAGYALPKLKEARTVSFGVKGAWDLIYGEQVSCLAGSKQHIAEHMHAWHYVETSMEGVGLTGGMLSPAHFHMYGCLRRHYNPGEVVLTGFLGDPHFGANGRLDRSEPGNPREVISAFLARFPNLTYEEITALLGDEIYDAIRIDLEQVMKDCTHSNLPSDYEEYYFIAERQPKLIIFINALCNTLEDVRMPFLDYELAEFLCSLPEKWRYERYIQKRLLIRDFPELARVPDSHVGAPLTASETQKRLYLLRRKSLRGYQWVVEAISGGLVSPVYPRWSERHTANLREELRGWFLSNLERLEARELFRPRSLGYYRHPFLCSRYDMVRFRLIALEQVLQWCQRWPRLESR